MSDFLPGQVWKYNTRPREEASRIIICQVESRDRLGTIVHIHVEGVAIRSPAQPGGVGRVVGHMPFSEQSVKDSVTALESTREALPDFEDGYATWKRAFDEGKGGIFTISVAEGLSFLEQALNQPAAQQDDEN